MLQLKSKKIYYYIFLFLIVGSLNNKNLDYKTFFKVSNVEIVGLSEKENLEIFSKLMNYEFPNLLLLNESTFETFFDTFNNVEKYSVFKKYPSSIYVELTKTNFIAYLNKQGKYFYIGSNKKLIETTNTQKKIPFVFGNLDIKEFFELRKIIDKSNFNYNTIQNLFFFPSGRWDLETQSGILIKLPKDNLKEKLNFSLNILKKENFKNIKIIDLRQNNQVIINEG
tara:strand:+ start:2761 stop:3435 length:675 start_codon:yes stop_codon:yes gene_type:complete